MRTAPGEESREKGRSSLLTSSERLPIMIADTMKPKRRARLEADHVREAERVSRAEVRVRKIYGPHLDEARALELVRINQAQQFVLQIEERRGL